MAKIAKKIASKFKEPRLVGQMDVPGGPTTLHTPGQKLPISGSTPEEALKAQQLVYGTPEQQAKMAEAFAAEAAPNISKRLKELRAERVREGSITSKIPEDGSSFAQKAIDAVGMPQRKLLQAIAQQLGQPGSDTDSEASSQQIVEALAERLGVPEGTVANAAKALAVGGLEVFADPLGPLSKSAKALKAAGRAPGASKLLRLEDANSVGQARRNINLAELVETLKKRPANQSTAARLAREGAKLVKPVGKVIRSRE